MIIELIISLYIFSVMGSFFYYSIGKTSVDGEGHWQGYNVVEQVLTSVLWPMGILFLVCLGLCNWYEQWLRSAIFSEFYLCSKCRDKNHYWECDVCGKIHYYEDEVFCWSCSSGSMIYRECSECSNIGGSDEHTS